MKNKRVLVTAIGGPEVLKIVEDEPLEPAPGEVRIMVKAAGVSQADITIREGMYPQSAKPPFTLGYDAVGVIDKIGVGVNGFNVGDLVAVITVRGSYTRYLCWSANDVILIPEGIEPAKAVCLLLNYLTAYQLLHRVAKVKSGDKILFHSAAGGVGTAIAQLGKLAGLQMYGTASTAKLDFVKSLGVTPIDYSKEDFGVAIKKVVPEGVDVVFDAIGGSSFTRSFETLKRGGHFVGYGFTAKMGQPIRGRLDTFARFGWMKLWSRGRKATFYGIMFMKRSHPEWFKTDLRQIFELFVAGKLDPVVAATFSLEEAAKALELLEKRLVTGKVVLIP
jgi:NADPH:quinone reductase-like Zn-dependent oxidoreductase